MIVGFPTTSKLFQCAMLTGARLGELLGLQWKHIDLEAQTLEIRQAPCEGELVSPKTEEGVRVIYFGPSLLSAVCLAKAKL
jgi:integrase